MNSLSWKREKKKGKKKDRGFFSSQDCFINKRKFPEKEKIFSSKIRNYSREEKIPRENWRGVRKSWIIPSQEEFLLQHLRKRKDLFFLIK